MDRITGTFWKVCTIFRLYISFKHFPRSKKLLRHLQAQRKLLHALIVVWITWPDISQCCSRKIRRISNFTKFRNVDQSIFVLQACDIFGGECCLLDKQDYLRSPLLKDSFRYLAMFSAPDANLIETIQDSERTFIFKVVRRSNICHRLSY